jgi:hypothetical protein
MVVFPLGGRVVEVVDDVVGGAVVSVVEVVVDVVGAAVVSVVEVVEDVVGGAVVSVVEVVVDVVGGAVVSVVEVVVDVVGGAVVSVVEVVVDVVGAAVVAVVEVVVDVVGRAVVAVVEVVVDVVGAAVVSVVEVVEDVVGGAVVSVVEVVEDVVVVVTLPGEAVQKTGTPASAGTPTWEILSLPFFVLTLTRFRLALATFSTSSGVRPGKLARSAPRSQRRFTLSREPSFRRLALSLHAAVISWSYSSTGAPGTRSMISSLRLTETKAPRTFWSVALLMVPSEP